jgi:hypothetical protein
MIDYDYLISCGFEPKDQSTVYYYQSPEIEFERGRERRHVCFARQFNQNDYLKINVSFHEERSWFIANMTTGGKLFFDIVRKHIPNYTAEEAAILVQKITAEGIDGL